MKKKTLLVLIALIIFSLVFPSAIFAQTWGPDTRLTSYPGRSNRPSIAVSGDNIHVAWQDSRDGNFEIYYKKGTEPASPPVPTGYNTYWLAIAALSLMVSGLFLLRRRFAWVE